MNDNAVTLAALGILATSVAGTIWLAKYFANTLSGDLREHTRAATKLADAADRQDASSKEVLVFMRALNGKLAKATIQTVKEQKVEHQTVNHQDSKE